MLGPVQRPPQTRNKPELAESLTSSSGLYTRLPWAWHGLSFAVPVLSGAREGYRELLTGTLPTQVGTVSVVYDRESNKAINTPSGVGVGYLDYPHQPTWTYPSSAFTFWFRAIFLGTCVQWAAMCGKAYTVGSFSSWVVYTSLANAWKLNLDINISGAPRATGAMVANCPVNQVINVFGRWKTGGTITLDVYDAFGKSLIAQKASAAVSGIIDWSTARVGINASDLTDGSAMHFETLCQWNRRLSDVECVLLSQDPWGWLSPRRETLGMGSLFPFYAPVVEDVGHIMQAG